MKTRKINSHEQVQMEFLNFNYQFHKSLDFLDVKFSLKRIDQREELLKGKVITITPNTTKTANIFNFQGPS